MKLLVILFISLTLYASSINRYEALDGCVTFNGFEYKALRQFMTGSKKMQLIVNPKTLESLIIYYKNKPSLCSRSFSHTRYAKLLAESSSPPYPLQNDGITHGKSGLYLTTDLCPSSKKGFEKRVYKALIDSLPHPIPLTLFITARWINSHQDAFKTLKEWDSNGSLAVTWGNHTALHIYHPKAELKHNFVLSPEENLGKDTLLLEKTLLEHGIVPSVFFRFPGLVSDEKAVKTINNLGLIIIGTDAWLAKDEKPKQGSIILIHGNKNEPKGVDIFLKMLKDNKITRLRSLRNLSE